MGNYTTITVTQKTQRVECFKINPGNMKRCVAMMLGSFHGTCLVLYPYVPVSESLFSRKEKFQNFQQYTGIKEKLHAASLCGWYALANISSLPRQSFLFDDYWNIHEGSLWVVCLFQFTCPQDTTSVRGGEFGSLSNSWSASGNYSPKTESSGNESTWRKFYLWDRIHKLMKNVMSQQWYF